jgi:hypothetical protein
MSESPSEAPAEVQKPDWRLGPIIIERKTSFTALAAFLVAVFAVFSLVRGILFGPELHISGIPHLYVYKQDCYRTTPGRPFLALGVPLHMANIGEKDYSLIVMRIDMTVAFSVVGQDKKYFYRSVDLAKFSRHNALGQYVCPQDNPGSASLIISDLKIDELDSFHDILIAHGKEVRQDVIFLPLVSPSARFRSLQSGEVHENYIWWDEFSRYLEGKDFDLNVGLSFQVGNEGWLPWLAHKLFGNKTLNCKIPFDPVTREILLKRNYVSRQSSCVASA